MQAPSADRNLMKVIDYIKKKNKKLENPLLEKLEDADDMVGKKFLEKSLDIYKEILKDDPYFYPAIEGVADRFFTLRRHAEAEPYFKKMLEHNPYKYSTYVRFAENQIFQNKYLEAKSLLEHALLIADEKHCYYLLQKCYNNLGNSETVNLLKRRTELVAENINFRDVEDLLLKLYNKSPFYRKLFILGYNFLKRIT